MNKKELKEQLLDFAKSYIEAYDQDWEGYDDALDFAQDGNTLAGLILEYFRLNSDNCFYPRMMKRN